MTNKEILGELTQCYRFLYDIRENGCSDHCCGQLKKEMIDKLEYAKHYVEELYEDFYDTLDKEELRVKGLYEEKGEKTYISRGIDCGYDVYKNDEYKEYFTCEDADYYWYDDNEFLDYYEEEE